MGVVNTNIPALNAMRTLNLTGMGLAKSIERLSSGLRINRAADDAAGLSISEKLRAQVRGLNQAVRNSQDGISAIQTAEGALGEVHAILQRMRELSVQAANETLTSDDRDAIQAEIDELSGAVDNISNSTQFNTLSLLTGDLSVTADDETFGWGLAAGMEVGRVDFSGAKDGYDYTFTDDLADGTILLVETNSNGDETRQERISLRGMIANDSQILNFSSMGISIQLTTDNTFDATADGDADIIAGTLDSGTSAATGSGGSVTIQTGANNSVNERIMLNFIEMSASALGVDALSLADAAGAQSAIDSLDAAIVEVSTQRATLGAKQNQLEHTIANLEVAAENATASESRIRDLDVASETVNFTKLQILQQAGTSILAQANAAPQNVLSLLR